MSPANRPVELALQATPPVDDESLIPFASDPRIRHALNLLCEIEAPRVSEVAGQLNLSTSRFRHLFKAEVGMSPRHYVRMQRLRRAKVLFETSLLRVKEVAGALGISDVSHFVRSYKDVYHQTPSQTRANSPLGFPAGKVVAVSANK